MLAEVVWEVLAEERTVVVLQTEDDVLECTLLVVSDTVVLQLEATQHVSFAGWEVRGGRLVKMLDVEDSAPRTAKDRASIHSARSRIIVICFGQYQKEGVLITIQAKDRVMKSERKVEDAITSRLVQGSSTSNTKATVVVSWVARPSCDAAASAKALQRLLASGEEGINSKKSCK